MYCMENKTLEVGGVAVLAQWRTIDGQRRHDQSELAVPYPGLYV